ncbi:MAG: DNA polymerase III subunit beta [Acidimicrobiia bacterium]|nr:DNA polymerase III subunit beta [Acidimicrobiia bacterium]
MRIRAERDDLADVLARAGRAVGTRSALPILQGLLCEVSGGTLRVTGTDTEITIETALDVEVLEEGRTVVPAKLVSEAVRKLPPGAVSFAVSEGEVEITGNGPRFNLREFDADDYPDVTGKGSDGNAVEMDGEALVAALNQVGVAASSDDGRPTLTGVLFETESDHLRLVATDSYRLAVRDVPAVSGVDTTLIPYRALREIGRTIAADAVSLSIGEREGTFSSERGRLTARVIESSFPNYRQLLPSEYPNRLTINREALLEAVGRASLVAEDHIPVRLSLGSGGVELSVSRQDVGGETEYIEAHYDGEDMIIAFNTRYLTDGVAAMKSENLVLETINPLKPGLLTADDDAAFRYLLMPVRL